MTIWLGQIGKDKIGNDKFGNDKLVMTIWNQFGK